MSIDIALEESLPREILVLILTFLEGKDVSTSVSPLNQVWYQIANSEELWRSLALAWIAEPSSTLSHLSSCSVAEAIEMGQLTLANYDKSTTWKEAYIQLKSFSFHPSFCSADMRVLGNGNAVVKVDNSGVYSIAIIPRKMITGTHFFEVTFQTIDSCFCVGVVNDPQKYLNVKSEIRGLGMIGYYRNGWGYFQDGDLCHSRMWKKGTRPFREGDRAGVLVEFISNPTDADREDPDDREYSGDEDDASSTINTKAATLNPVARVCFYHNGSRIQYTYRGVKGPLWFAASQMYGGTIKITSTKMPADVLQQQQQQ